jgi:pimeloyl-ACP methyl ester carboxylesterase
MRNINHQLKMKPNLLLLHGALGSDDTLQPLAQALEEHFSVHTLNFPGHGGTEMPDHFAIPSFVNYVKNFCNENHLQQASIFGYSMGGYVAMHLAKQQPELVKKMATLATKFHWDEATSAREVKMLQPDVIEQKVPKLAAQLQQRHAPNDWKQLVQQTAAMLSAMGADNPLKPEDYAGIQTPVLIMLGDRDKMVSMDETLNVYKGLPQAQLAVLPSTPHPLEQVDVNLLAFLLKQFFV